MHLLELYSVKIKTCVSRGVYYYYYYFSLLFKLEYEFQDFIMRNSQGFRNDVK